MRFFSGIPLLAFACSAEPAQHVQPLTLGEDGGSPSEPVDPPPSGTGAGGTAGSTSGASGSTSKGGSAGSSGTSGSAGTHAGTAGRAGSAGTSGTAGTGQGGSAGQAGAPMGGAGSSGSSGSSGTAGTAEGGEAGSPDEPPPEPKCLVRRMAPNDDQCLVREIPGCPQVGELIAAPNHCVWSTDTAKHDGCSSESTHLDCQPMCAGTEEVTKVVSFKRYTTAKIFVYEGPHIRCWDIATQTFGTACDEACDQAAQKHEAYSCGSAECIADWDFEPLCEQPIPTGDDLNSCS
jgi:hypothetical protein